VPPPLIDSGHALLAWRALRERSEAVVDEARGRLAKRWHQAGARLLDGDAREALVEAATSSRADLVVLGARGLGRVRSLMLGSVSLGVARHAPCAVLVCKGDPRPVRSVTVALDGSPNAEAALTYLSRLPLPADVTVTLIAVVEPMQYPPATPEMFVGPAIELAMQEYEVERRAELSAVLSAAAERMRSLGGRVRPVIGVGRAADAILREVGEQGSDLIVVGARGLGRFERALLGSVSESVLRGARCPVLVVRRSP
jgi:nucleotide-binding universal stress UspA family protein